MARLSRSIVSYIPSSSLFALRSLRDLPARARRLPHEPDFEVFGAFVFPDAVFVDIGANRGQSIRSMRLFAPQATIHAFEPNPLLAEHVTQRFAGPQLHVHPCGLGAEPSSLLLHLPRYGHTVYDTRAALTPQAAGDFLSEEHFVAFSPDRAAVITEEVEIRTLDSFALRPHAVKIDVEGADAAVIEGGWDTITRHQPLLMIEFPSADTRSRLQEVGYVPHELVEGVLVPSDDAELNTLFLQPSHLEILRASAPALLSS